MDTLMEPNARHPFAVVGRKGKIVKFRKLRSPKFRNIAELYAQAYGESGVSSTEHACFCGCCGRSTTLEAIAKRRTFGWEWAGDHWVCPTCNLESKLCRTTAKALQR